MTTVLIADNDCAVSDLLMDALARHGLLVEQVFDGEAARQRARSPQVGVVVCDLDMPRASGVEVLESLADLPSPPAAVVISGYLDHEVVDRLRQLPFVREVLRKPFDLLKFAERIRQLVDAAGAMPER